MPDQSCPFPFRHPVIAIAYGPLVAFGLLNLVIGNRAIFYSAPIMGWRRIPDNDNARFIAANLSEGGMHSTRPGRQHTAAFVAIIIAGSIHRQTICHVPASLNRFWKVWHP